MNYYSNLEFLMSWTKCRFCWWSW